MGGEWRVTTLYDANVSVIDCDHRTPPDAGVGYQYVAIPQLRDGRIDLADVRRITQKDYTAWTRKASPREHDVVLSRRCNPGTTAVVSHGMEFALGQNLVILRADGTTVFPPFLRWIVRSHAWWEQIDKYMNVGAVFDSLRCADIPAFEVPLPPLPEQRAIAHILGTLDDKIELNRRMCETLEAMARALFKSWFVDFDPVRARMEGRDTGLPREIAALFPDKVVESELGEIPEGWRVGTVGDVADALRDAVNPLACPDALFVHHSIPAYDDSQRPVIEAGAEIKSAKSRVPVGSVLVSKLNPATQRVWLVDVLPEDVAVCSTEFVVLLAREPYDRSFVYGASCAEQTLARLRGMVTGTSGSHQRVPVEALMNLPLALPPEGCAGPFKAQAEPLHCRALACRRESRSLAALRDTLLPKLVSGEVRVGDAERFLAG